MTHLQRRGSAPTPAAPAAHVNLEDRLLAMIRLFHAEPKLRGQDAWAAMLAETGGSAVFDSSHTAMARCYAGGFPSAMIGRLDALVATYRVLPDLKPVDAWKRMCQRFDINVVVDYKMVGMAQRMAVNSSILARLTAPAAPRTLATPDIPPGRVIQRSAARLMEALPPTATTATMAIAPAASEPVVTPATLAPLKTRAKRGPVPLVVHAPSTPVIAPVITSPAVTPAARTRKSKLDAYRDWLGVAQDAAIAAAAGMTKGGVTLYRKRMGVPWDGTLLVIPALTANPAPAVAPPAVKPALTAPVVPDLTEMNRSSEAPDPAPAVEPALTTPVTPDLDETNRSFETLEPVADDAPAAPSMPTWMPSAVVMAVVELVAQLAAQGIRSFTLTPTSFAGKRERVVVEVDEWEVTL